MLETVDELREWPERILDGGREAFRLRGERYGHFPRAHAAGNAGDAGDSDAENGA